MTSEQWERVKEVFETVSDLPPEQRKPFLAQACHGDEELRREVESLLVAHDADSGFMNEPVGKLLTDNKSALKAGQRLGPYEVVSQVGEGGMGQVYQGFDTRLRRSIALKLLPSSSLGDVERVRRFEQEAQAASALNHPNIVTIHEIGQTDSLHFIAAEFVDGETLRTVIANQRMTIMDVLNIAIQVASALHAAHENGIVHRDIKPENIMIRRDGYVKVLDFGLAKLTEQSAIQSIAFEADRNTNPGMVMGTPRYMSPEQARGSNVDARTDIFSLGVIIYEMVTGQAPFEGSTPSDIIAALLKDDPEPLSEVVPEVPPELERVVKRALSKNRDDRYQSIAELSADLYQLKDAFQLNAKLGQINTAGPSLRTVGFETAAALRKFKSTDPEALPKTKSLGTLPKKKPRAVIAVAALLIAVVGIIAITSIRARRAITPDTNQPRRLSGRALTIRSGLISAARFAPDGQTVIYSAAFDGRPLELFASNLDGSDSRSLGIPSAALKDISPTGEIAVLFNFELNWNDGRNGTLALVTRDGGEPRVVEEGIDEAAFTPDGKSLAIVRAAGGYHQLEYPAGVVLHKSEGWISYPRFSRAGDRIAFFEHPIGDNSGSLVVLDLTTKTTSTLSAGWRALKGLAWSPTGDAIWFGGSKVSKKQNINSVSLSGEEHLNLDEMASYSKLEDMSAEGTLLISHGNTHSTVVTLSDDSKNEDPSTRYAWSTSADISSDGQALLFYEWGWESRQQVQLKSTYLRRFDGSNPIKLGEGRALALSPDNKWALAIQEDSPPKLALLSTTGDKAVVLPNPGFKEYHYGSWFPDGRRILFTALEARGSSFLRSYVQDVLTGVVSPLTEEGTVALRISPDGTRMVARDAYGNYYVRSVDSEDSETLLEEIGPRDEPIQWSTDGRSLYVREAGDFATKIYRVDIASGRRREWRDIVPPNPVGLVGIEAKPGGIVITPDGRVCVYTYWTTLHELLLMDSL